MIKEVYHSVFSDIDVRFARLMIDLAGVKPSHPLFPVSSLLCHFTLTKRNSCLDLATLSGKSLHDILDFADIEEPDQKEIALPDMDTLAQQLRDTSPVGIPGEYTPLVLDERNRLYLFRYWEYEQKLAAGIADRIHSEAGKRTKGSGQLLDQLFPDPKTDPDWQRRAADSAVSGRLTMISGGPGTGKTHTVTSILALLISEHPELAISLCAPTGKAAARLQDSIQKAKKQMSFLNPRILNRIPERAGTIHRLLGVRKGSASFKHNPGNPVIADVVVVDEASMVSLAMMSKLIQAIPKQTKLILLGDKNQLSSVEAGAVFGDICDAGRSLARLSESIVELQYSYRFEQSPGIGEISSFINQGDVDGVLKTVKKATDNSLVLQDQPKSGQLKSKLNQLVTSRIKPLLEAKSLAEGFVALEQFKILCSYRKGEFGVEAVNRAIEQLLVEQGVIKGQQDIYKGKPIIVKQNDYQVNLYNGDTGIIWPDKNGRLRAYFPAGKQIFSDIGITRLPPHQAAYALTIHESQGSEFSDILIVLGDKASPLLSKELLYTAVTRAKANIEIWADRELLSFAITNTVQRQTGLQQKLRQMIESPV
ncbi:MAG: exodeoxyribonuclease V subunit alpha [Proteobacteria bacterium]|nr:exodeoxyribonuclease V subunit alpha [Pseudomonadota bacterium]